MDVISKFFSAFSRYIFNLKQILFPHISKTDIHLIKNTWLFSDIEKEQDLKKFCGINLIKYSANKLIFLEGEQGDALYIIKDGSVRVFTYDQQKKKIPLARLNQGDYFGEQAVLGQAVKTRNANIESITDVTLIKINKEFIKLFFQKNTAIRPALTKKGYKQALEMLSLSSDFYNNIESIVPNLHEASIVDYPQNKLIFNAGDEPDNVYIILRGEIKLQILNKKTNSYSSLLLHKGQLFGELGVLNNKPRSATAMTNSDVRLLLVDSHTFKKYLSGNEKLQNILEKLQQVYQIPIGGVVEQYIGDVQNIGQAITNIYKMDDGRKIIASHFLNQDLFMMSTVNNAPQKQCVYKNKKNKIEIGIIDNRIVSLVVHGLYDNLPAICHCILGNEVIESTALTHFELTGKLATHVKDDTLICECMSVTRSRLQQLIDQGVNDLDGLSRSTGACTACRGCSSRILEMLGKNFWLSATMRKIDSHNGYINNYRITSKDKINLFKPGQYIIIQVKVNNNWVERPYTISNVYSDGELRITIKKLQEGLFTQWLFENAQQELDVYITQPQGSFVLNPDAESLCFAGGIGITPFVMFAHVLSKAPVKKKIHIHYTASTDDDFVFKDEFNSLSEILSPSLIDYKATQLSGSLTEDIVVNEIKLLNEPDIYICGPEGYVRFVENVLKKINYGPAKIHVEKFVYAGAGLMENQD